MNEYFSYPDLIRIDKVAFYKIAPIPLPVPFKDGTGNVRNASLFGSWMKVYDADGICGQGPCTPLMASFFTPLLLKEGAKTVDGWREYFYWQIRNFGYQSAHVSEMGALDMILLDLLANRAGKPLHRFLGARRDWCNVYKGGGSVLLSDQELVADLVRFKSEGYRQTKFKIGYGTDWAKDIRRLEKVRLALGDGFGIAVDANQAWDVDTAFEFAREAAAYGVSWFEEPIHAYDMAGLLSLHDRLEEAGVNMSIAMGESVRSYHSFEEYAEHGVDHLQPGNARMYCIGENMKVCALAKEKGAMLSSGGFTFQNVVMGTLYGEDAMIEYHQPIMEVLVPYFSVMSEIKDGKFYLPDIPGLPVQMDFDKLEKDGLLEQVVMKYRKEKI